MNIRMEYLYRDAGNYKNWGDVVFSNPNGVPIQHAEKMVNEALIDHQYFLAKSVGVPDLHFPEFNTDLDHHFHEFYALVQTEDTPDDLQKRSIEQLADSLRGQKIS